jgi:2'-5' RNA ligase
MGGSSEFEIAAPEFEISPPTPKLRPEDQAQIDKAIRSVPLSRPDYMQTEHPLTDWFSGNEPTPVSPEANEEQRNLEQFRKERRAQRQRPSAGELATGLASTAAEMFTNPDPLAVSTEPSGGAQTRRGITQLRTPGQRGTGVANLADVGLQALTPLMGPAIAENPVSIAKGFVEGGVASKAAGYVSKKAGANPEQQDLAQDIAFWMPGVARSVLDPRANVVSTDQVKGATIGVRGAGAGVAVTPESVNIGGRVGPFKGSVSIPRNGAAAARPALEPPTIEGSQVDPSSQMLADHEVIQQRAARVASGLPPVEPPPPPTVPSEAAQPRAPKVTEISADDIQHIAGIIQRLPPHLRSQGLLEAHQTMSRILEQNGRVIGPNGRLVLIDSQKAAEKIAADWVNDEVSRQDELADQAAKAQTTAVLSEPDVNPLPRKSRRAQQAEIEQKALEVAAPRLHFEVVPPEKAAVESGNGATVPVSVEPHGQEGTNLPSADAGNHEQLSGGVSDRQPQSGNQPERTEEVRRSAPESALPVSGVTEKTGFQKGQPVRFSKDFDVRKGQNQEVAETIPQGTPAYIEHAGEGMNFVRLSLADGRKLAVNQRAIEIAPEAQEKPKYASTQINLPEAHAKQVIEAGKKLIRDEDLAGKGREGEPHVTLKYGVHENENALRRVLAEHKPFEATLGKIKIFPPTDNSEGTAPVVAEINAPELKPLHEAIHKAVGAKEDDFDYKPHVTLAYVKPEAAMKYEGSTALEGTKIPIDRISLSRADRTQQALSLGQKEEVEHPPLRGEVGTMKTSELKLAPNRFQYKLGTDAEGVSTLLKEQDKFNPDLAGVISVWRDPHDGKFYVVNGHHRFELAKRTGQRTIPVRHIAAPDAEQARSIGALQNIAEGRGTPIDAAKFFRDSRVTPEHLKDVGISLGEATARQGLALSRLDTSLFNKVVAGHLRLGRAVAIGEATDDPAEQKAILNLVDKKEARGQKISDGVLSELIRFVKESGQAKETTADLFGSQEITKSLALEKAEISDYIRQQLSKDRKLFGFVSKEGRAEDLARAGNKIEVEKSKEFSTTAQQAEEIYNRLSSRGGEIADILDQAARRLAEREDAAAVKSDAYKRIREAVRRTLEGRTAERASGPEGIPGSSGEPQEPAPAAAHIQHTVEPTLPGMESVPAERAEANAEQQGKELSEKLTEPPKSVERAAGEIEQKSPLFRDTEANPQESLFAGRQAASGEAKALPEVIDADRAGILQSEIKHLKGQAEELSKQVSAKGIYHPDAKALTEKHTEIRRQVLAKEDELAKLRGEPTRSEKRDLQTKEAEKPFAERPEDALKYDNPAQSQHWQVAEPDYIKRRFADRIKSYERAVTESEQEMSAAKPGTKKYSEAAGALEYRKKMLQRYKDNDALEAHRFRTEYNDLVKKAVSQGKPVPQAVIDQKPEFKLAQDARERYEKGRHTSFANKSAAINDTMQKEEGFKVKRQDGKPITDAQIKEISDGVSDVVKVLGGPLRDAMRGTDLTIAHTSGKHPFLSDAGGMYHPVDRTITAGIEDFLGRPVKALAHELGHWFDFESGRAIGVKSRIYTKDGKGTRNAVRIRGECCDATL